MKKKWLFLFSVFTVIALATGMLGCRKEAPPAGTTSPTTSPSPTATSPVTTTTPPVTTKPATTTAVPTLEKVLIAIGGRQAVQDLRNFSFEATGKRWLLFEGISATEDPVERTAFTVLATYDIAGNNLRLDYARDIDFLGVKTQVKPSEIIAGNLGVISGAEGLRGGAALTNMLSERMASIRRQQRLLNPHIILNEVANGKAKSSDGGTETIGGVQYNLLVMEDKVFPVTLYVDSATGLISKLSTKENDWLRRDTALEVFYRDWRGTEGGPLFPNEVTIRLAGDTIHQESRKSVKVNQTLATDFFKFPEGAAPAFEQTAAERGEKSSQFYQMFAAVGVPREGFQTTVTPVELAPGVFHLTGGSHHSMVIEQEKGIVVVEAPLDEARSKALLAWIKGKFPNKPITHVIPTHHHIDHSGGLRTFAAEGATIVVHQASMAFWTDAFRARSTILPDDLEKKPTTVKIDIVLAGGSYKIPDAVRPVTVYDTPSAHSNDGVAIVADKEGILFVSDLYSPGPTATVGPTALELNNMILKNQLLINIIAGGHGGTNTMQEFRTKVAEATK